MPFRNIIVTSPGKISVKNSQLVIQTDTEHSVPIEDIVSLLVENQQVTITTAALSSLGEHGCNVYFCDKKHMPSVISVPFLQHSRGAEIIERQMSLNEVLKKHLWQNIVISKIQNQAECLRLTGKQAEAESIETISRNVKSGDRGNAESFAALRYFPSLFGKGFSRSADDGYNSALNYGYAIIRGCVARNLASYGFLPALGLHHRNMTNNFNLADDLIEPFRPVIDLLVYSHFSQESTLTPKEKQILFNSLNLDILSEGQRHTVANAIEREVYSLSTSIEVGSPCLRLPVLLEEKQHTYE